MEETNGKINNDEVMEFFSIHIPTEDVDLTNDTPIVTTRLQELHPLLKRNPHARFRVFKTHEEAIKFTMTPDVPQLGTPTRAKFSNCKGRVSLPSPMRTEKRNLIEERGNNFPTPKAQENTMLNINITRKENDKFLMATKQNPRLLCNDCDLAPAVQEGSKLNALHAAAKVDNAQAVEIVFKAITDISFYKQLYPKDESAIRIGRCKHLNNSYLNTPDKMLLETPLHVATKFCSVDVVRLLVSHPLCNLYPRNGQDQTPFDIVGSRYNGDKASQKKSKIIALLENIYIVPIWRDVLNSMPTVGNYGSWRSFGGKIPKVFTEAFPNIPNDLLGSCEPYLVPACRADELGTNISSYAGPMNLDKAKELYGMLKGTVGRRVIDNQRSPFGSPIRNCSPKRTGLITPPLSSPLRSPPLASSPIYSAKDLVLPVTPTKSVSTQSWADMSVRMEDGVKGMERLGRKYSKKLNVDWCEYWPFLDRWCNLETQDGLQLLEKFLLSKEKTKDSNPELGKPDFEGWMKKWGNSLDLCDVPLQSGVISAKEIGNFGSLERSFVNNNGNHVFLQERRVTKTSDGIDHLVERLQIMSFKDSSTSLSSPEGTGNTLNRCNPDSPHTLSNGEERNIYDNESDLLHFGLQDSPQKLHASLEIGITKLNCWEYREILNSSSVNSSSADLNCSNFDFSNISTMEQEDEDDKLSFTTATSDESESEEEFEDCVDCTVYIDGSTPKERDRQVLFAIHDALDENTLQQYPAISRWYNSVKAFGCIVSQDNNIRWNSPSPRTVPKMSLLCRRDDGVPKRVLEF